MAEIVDPRHSVLSLALCSRSFAGEMCSALVPEDFSEGQRPLYNAIRAALSAEGELTGPIISDLERSGIAEPYGYIQPYLAGTGEQTGLLLYDPEGQRIVFDSIRNDRVRRGLTDLIAEKRYDEIPQYLSGISKKKETADGPITGERIDEFMALIDANAQKKTLGVPTGLPTLDEITGGMIPGTVWAIGAPTSAGKTTLLCQAVIEAIRNGAVCHFYSLEMSTPLMYSRLAGAWCGINPFNIFRGRISSQERSNVDGALRLFSELGLQVFRSITDASEIARRSRELSIAKPVRIIAVDFMQNVTAKAENMLQRMAEGSRILQGMAGDLNACVLIASQLSNEAVKEKAGGIFSYRYASELSHAADVGIEMVPGTSTGTELHVRKNRHGRTGKVDMKFNPTFSGFIETISKKELPSFNGGWGNN